MDQQQPQVVLRGPGDGDSTVLTMGPHRAHITRKAARTETGGHWAVGEARQDPGFDNPPHTHDEAEAFYVLDGSYTFYTDADPVEEVGSGTFVLIPPGAVHGFRTDRKAAGSSVFGPRRSRPRSSTTKQMVALVRQCGTEAASEPRVHGLLSDQRITSAIKCRSAERRNSYTPL